MIQKIHSSGPAILFIDHCRELMFIVTSLKTENVISNKTGWKLNKIIIDDLFGITINMHITRIILYWNNFNLSNIWEFLNNTNQQNWCAKVPARGSLTTNNLLSSDILKTKNISKSIIEPKMFRISFWTSCTFHFVLTWTDNSWTVRSSWTVVEQEMYNNHRTFFWYQAEWTGSMNKGARRVQIIWRILYYLNYEYLVIIRNYTYKWI